MPKAHLKTTRAWQLKETLRGIFQESDNSREAATGFDAWYSWARRCRLEPFKKLAKTLKQHREGMLNGFDSKLSKTVTLRERMVSFKPPRPKPEAIVARKT